MSSGQAGSPDVGTDGPQGEPSAPSPSWKEGLRQRQMAAQAALAAQAASGGSGSGSGNSSDTLWYMRSDGQSTSLNYFIPIGVLLGLVTLACVFVGFWWRRRMDRQRRHRAAEQPADPEQGRLPRCSLESEAGCPPHLPKIPVLIVCPDNKPSFGWQLEECQLSSMPSTHSMHSEASGSCASANACCSAGGKGSCGGKCGCCCGKGGSGSGCGSGCSSPTCSVGGTGEAGPSGSASPSPRSSLGVQAFSPAASDIALDAEQPGSQTSQQAAGSGASPRAEQPAGAAQGGPAGPTGPASDPLAALLVPHLAAALAAMPVAVVPIARHSSRQQGEDEVWPPRPQPRRAARPSAAPVTRQRRPPMYTIEVAAPAGEEEAPADTSTPPAAAEAAAAAAAPAAGGELAQ